MGLVKTGEISNYNNPFNRYQMARIIVRACKEEYGDYNIYQGNIKDYNKIPTEYREFVLNAYSKGIINGLPDGTFGGDKTMRRSEATAVIARLLDKSQRVTPQLPKIDNDLINVTLISEAKVEISPIGNKWDHDFSMIFLMEKPLKPQYTDAENLLKARFGENNAKVKEIIDYIKLKDIRKKELPDKEWIINGQTVKVGSGFNSMDISLQVWRVIK